MNLSTEHAEEKIAWLYHMTIKKTIKSTYEITMLPPAQIRMKITWLYHMAIKKQ